MPAQGDTVLTVAVGGRGCKSFPRRHLQHSPQVIHEVRLALGFQGPQLLCWLVVRRRGGKA